MLKIKGKEGVTKSLKNSKKNNWFLNIFGNEIMDQNTLIPIVACIFIFLVIFTILRSLVKAAIVLIVIVLLFKIGWVYTSEDLKSKFNLDDFVEREHREKLYEGYDNFREKGKKEEVINTDKINDKVDNLIDKNLNDKVKDYINKNE